jgi:hypothetical protein
MYDFTYRLSDLLTFAADLPGPRLCQQLPEAGRLHVNPPDSHAGELGK